MKDGHHQKNLLVTTGLLGSVRWWFEVVVRGLGGSACDPSKPGARCPDRHKMWTDPGHRCVVCELFGCTGWARKFRFEVVDEDDQPVDTLVKDTQKYKFRFVPLRDISDCEWALLDLTLRIIADFGAMGGRTTGKPSVQKHRENLPHHKDYGLIRLDGAPDIPQKSKEDLQRYVGQKKWRQYQNKRLNWASLQHFWCVQGLYLARKSKDRCTYNQVIGRKESSQEATHLQNENEINKFLAGGIGRSKKVFSFKNPKEARRTYGFVDPPLVEFNEMKKRLREAWKDNPPGIGFKDEMFLTGAQILEELLTHSFKTGGRDV